MLKVHVFDRLNGRNVMETSILHETVCPVEIVTKSWECPPKSDL